MDMDLMQHIQGAIHAAEAREKAGFSGGIHWRTVVPWLRKVEELLSERSGRKQLENGMTSECAGDWVVGFYQDDPLAFIAIVGGDICFVDNLPISEARRICQAYNAVLAELRRTRQMLAIRRTRQMLAIAEIGEDPLLEA